MRTLEQIRIRLHDSSTGEAEKVALQMGLGQKLDEQISHLRLLYDLAISEAERHRINERVAKEAYSLAWVIGSNTKFETLPYFQFNLPRLRMIGREFLFPWPNKPSLWRMAAGGACNPACIHCNKELVG